MNFFTQLEKIIGVAAPLVPVAAAARAQADPSVSNAGLINTAKAVAVAQPLVAAGEALSAQNVAAGQPALTGAQKLAIAQDAVEQAHAMVLEVGGTTQTFDAYWPLLDLAITAICKARSTAPASQPAAAPA